MQKSISDLLSQRKSKKLHEYILLGGQMGKIPIQWLLFLRIVAIFFVSYHLVTLFLLVWDTSTLADKNTLITQVFKKTHFIAS